MDIERAVNTIRTSAFLAMAEDAKPVLNTGDTAWMLTSTALVLLTTITGFGTVLWRYG